MGAEGLKEAIGKLARVRKSLPPGPGVNTSPGCAFGAVVDQRLKDMEGHMGELKARLNGLIFIVVGAVVVEVVTRLLR